jgi:hypothetical protein
MKRRVALTQIGDATISTVLLAYHEPPEWETMVFGGRFNRAAERYDSRDAAEYGHNAWVGRITRTRLPVQRAP